MKILDLFCGAGGAAMGYHRAGFEVIGVDIVPQPHYPFEFYQRDAIEAIAVLSQHCQAIHASPPCQAYSIATLCHGRAHARTHPDLVGPVRDALAATGLPYVIENVHGSPLRMAVMLCGTMFDLRVLRHRYFETSFGCLAPSHLRHPKGDLTNAHRKYSTGESPYVCVAGHNFQRAEGELAMGIDWMGSRREIAQAIPPAYTEFIGKQLMAVLLRKSGSREVA